MRFRILLMLLLTTATVQAGNPDCRWVETEGRAVAEGNVTVDNVRRMALDRARQAAVEQETGVSLYGTTTVKDAALVNDFVHSASEGIIVQEKEPVWSTEMYVPAPGKPGAPAYTARLSACVAVAAAGRDPDFRLKLTTSKPVYLSGEEVNLVIHSSRDSFLSLFHIDEDDGVTPLIPSQLQKRVPLKSNTAFSFPAEGVAMRTVTNPGHSKDTDYFLAVATREWVDFGQLLTGRPIHRHELMKTVAGISPSSRAIALIGYDIVAR